MFVEIRKLSKMWIEVRTMINQQVNSVVFLLPIRPFRRVVEFVHQHMNTEPPFDTMDQIRLFVQNLGCWSFTSVVVPAINKEFYSLNQRQTFFFQVLLNNV